MTAERLLSYFGESRFVPELRSRSKDGVLGEMARVLADEGEIGDPALLLEMIRRRESLGSTGLGKGVAVPHGRSTAATDTRIVFALSKKGVDFGALDNEPCRLFFLIVAPYEDRKHEYLPLLGKIVEVVSDEAVRERLLQVDSFGAFTQTIREAFGE
ncbi:MAG: PTS sugar transporter subunit IIA [Candidatus Eisenbacteria sp.]|nr:PTS sugar transporter subunit IIA [Candidatus Eisenbacteria bacterium]